MHYTGAYELPNHNSSELCTIADTFYEATFLARSPTH